MRNLHISINRIINWNEASSFISINLFQQLVYTHRERESLIAHDWQVLFGRQSLKWEQMRVVYCKIVRFFYINEFISEMKMRKHTHTPDANICKCFNTSHQNTIHHINLVHIWSVTPATSADFPIIFRIIMMMSQKQATPSTDTDLIVCACVCEWWVSAWLN